jgi:FkbH-like protein
MRQRLLEALRSVLVGPPGTAVIHSSLASLGLEESPSRWDVLYALDRLCAQGWTIALPSFTFRFCGGRPFHHARSASEVGILADWMLEGLPASRRTPHPIYSFVVAGPQADRIAACPSSTTFGDDSPFGWFERENAALVMLGCDWRFATQFHRYEEIAGVPYRYFKQFSGRADYGDGAGEHDVTASMYVRHLDADPANDFSPAVARLRADHKIGSTPLWRGRVESVRVADLALVCSEMLQADRMAFVSNAAAVAYRLAKVAQASQQPALRVAVLGNANVHLLRSALEAELRTLLLDRRTETLEVPYGQLRQALLDPSSNLRRWQSHVAIFCDRLEDLLGEGRLDAVSTERVAELVTEYADLIAQYHAAAGGWILVDRFAALYRSSAEDGGRALTALTSEMNGLLERKLADLPQVLWVDVATQAASEGIAPVDFRLWHMGRFPFSEPFSRVLARRWCGLILASLGRSVRALVLDLDNTLWGGVLGEEGISGLQLGGDFPGNAYLAFQKSLRALTSRGVALAICSKNDEDLALQAIEKLSAMQLRSNDFVARRINWRPKWENIREIAAELNLGIESVMLIDDNPAEREAVRRNLPGLKVLDLPEDPALYAQALASSPWLEVAQLTAEDRKRVAGYRARRQVEQQRATAANLKDFYASLQMKLHLQPLNEGNSARAAQLCVKTNQFNTTTQRYDQRALRRIVEERGDVVVVGLEDRHSELENIGVIILRPDGRQKERGVVDSYLLSCRVLGRGIETAVLHWALRRAGARGWREMTGAIVETERNTPVRNVFRDAGFQPGERSGEWVARTTPSPELPQWLTVVDAMPSA